MGKQTFEDFILKYEAIWNVTFTKTKKEIWQDILLSFKIKGLLEVLSELAKTESYAPGISQIREHYEYLSNNQKLSILENEKKHTKLLAEQQEKCYLCTWTAGFSSVFTDINNTKISVERNSECKYEVLTRCTCAKGKDLNIFSKSQINLEYCRDYNENERKNGNKAIYIKDILEFTNQEFIDMKISFAKEKEYRKSENNEIQLDFNKFQQQIINQMSI